MKITSNDAAESISSKPSISAAAPDSTPEKAEGEGDALFFENKALFAEFKYRSEHCDEYLGDINAGIINVMESTRKLYKIPLKVFASLIGLPYASYHRIVTGKGVGANYSWIFRFCYIFGYDLETFNNSQLFIAEQDKAVLELGIRFGGLSDATIDAIVTLLKSNVDSSRRSRDELSDTLKMYKRNRALFTQSIIGHSNGSKDDTNAG